MRRCSRSSGPSGSGKSSLCARGCYRRSIVGRSCSSAPANGRRPSSRTIVERVRAERAARRRRRPVRGVVRAVGRRSRATGVHRRARRGGLGSRSSSGDPARACAPTSSAVSRRTCELADLLGPNQVLLGPMTAGELRRAIEGPAERAGLDGRAGTRRRARRRHRRESRVGCRCSRRLCSTSGTTGKDVP